jgi:DNA-binding PadR family transcriptional regulator
MTSQEEILEQLPLTEATFFILTSLSVGKKHGYLIMQDVELLSAGRVMLSTGTLYGGLSRLLDYGWIERVDEEEETGRPRKAYVLTELGRRILGAETQRLERLARMARLRLAEG